jgi:hypothetical protein
MKNVNVRYITESNTTEILLKIFIMSDPPTALLKPLPRSELSTEVSVHH